jgi:hypothetical protein
MSEALIYGGLKGAISLTTSEAVEQIVAHLVEKNGRRVVGKFSYPAREGYETLTEDGNIYTGVLLPEMTAKAATEQLTIEVKDFVNDDWHPIGVGDVARVVDNTVKNIEAV